MSFPDSKTPCIVEGCQAGALDNACDESNGNVGRAKDVRSEDLQTERQGPAIQYSFNSLAWAGNV